MKHYNTPEKVLKYWFNNNQLDSIEMNTLSYIKRPYAYMV